MDIQEYLLCTSVSSECSETRRGQNYATNCISMQVEVADTLYWSSKIDGQRARDCFGPFSPRKTVPWASDQSSPRSECSSSSRWFSLFSGAMREVTAPWSIVWGSCYCCQPRRRDLSWPPLATSAGTALSWLPLSRRQAVPRDDSAMTATALHRSGSPCAKNECISEGKKERERGGSKERKREGRERSCRARGWNEDWYTGAFSISEARENDRRIPNTHVQKTSRHPGISRG